MLLILVSCAPNSIQTKAYFLVLKIQICSADKTNVNLNFEPKNSPKIYCQQDSILKQLHDVLSLLIFFFIIQQA